MPLKSKNFSPTMRFNFITFVLLWNSLAFSQSFVGDWYGTLDAMGQKLPLVVHLSDSSGQWKGTLDSPNQGAAGIPMTNVHVEGKTLRFSIDQLRASYEGTFKEDSGIEGTFKQGAFKAPLTFSSTQPTTAAPKKLQDRKEPVPYSEIEVDIPHSMENFSLSGTLSYPHQASRDFSIKYPCIVLISGSGPQDRNEEILGHRPFLVLADRLTLAGYSVFRYDDRGTGKSTGTFDGATSADFSTDVVSVVNYLKTMPMVDSSRVMLMGHSEGGMIANMVAAQHPEIYGVVSLAGPGIKGSDLLVEQQCLISKAVGASEKEVKKIRSFSETFYPILTLDSLPLVRKRAEEFLTDYVKRIKTKELRKSGIEDRKTWVQMNLLTYVNPWMIYFLNYNPAVDLKRIQCHYLALNGTNDLQVPSKMNLEAISAHCNPGLGKVKRIQALAGLNHLFQPSLTGNPNEYGSNEITFDTVAIQAILTFLDEILH
jgi:pimeloyl-ACP methyl ester carboxylesterase